MGEEEIYGTFVCGNCKNKHTWVELHHGNWTEGDYSITHCEKCGGKTQWILIDIDWDD